jgi:sugar lactone lactonase YvrE
MKKQTMYALLLCAALFLSVDIVPTLSEPALSDTVPLEPPYVFLQSWGNEMGVFHNPGDIAINGERVYVCDTHSNRIQIFDLHGKPLATFGGADSDGDRQLNWPRGIAVEAAPSGNVYVADTENHRIVKFTADGTFLTQWGASWSVGYGQLSFPQGIAVDGDGNVYVADTGNHRIVKFELGGDVPDPVGGAGLRERAVQRASRYRGG